MANATTSTGTIAESGRQISRGTARPLLLLLLTTIAPIGTAAAHFSGGIPTVGPGSEEDFEAFFMRGFGRHQQHKTALAKQFYRSAARFKRTPP